MAKVIRPRYSVEVSIGILLLIFVLSLFLSPQLFEIETHNLNEGKNVYVGMVLVSVAVIIMLLVLWEEFLFPVKVKPEEGGLVFRNHRNKLITQSIIYCVIPVIFSYIYMQYEVSLVRFLIWAAICVATPVAGKLISGLKNYNDFLKLTPDSIEYKNNEKGGIVRLKDVQQITLIKDQRNVLHKIQLELNSDSRVHIDLDEMELDAFIDVIDKFMTTRYKNLLKTTSE